MTREQFTTWLLANAGEGWRGYEAGKAAWLRNATDHTPAEYEDFTRRLAQACGV